MQSFEVTLDWSISYTTHKTGIAYEEITTKMGLYNDTLAPWITALKNIYGIPNNNFDGYIKNVVVDTLNWTITIECYLVDSHALEGFIVVNLDCWQEEQIKAIEFAFRKHATQFTSTIDGEVRAKMRIGKVVVKSIV